MLLSYLRKESGATLVEYGVALILAIIIGGTALSTLGTQTGANMNTACQALVVTGVADNC